jgi:hypothetical protein
MTGRIRFGQVPHFRVPTTRRSLHRVVKTQAEISLRTDRQDVRNAALAQIVAAVNRTSRLVRQLLASA